MILEILIGALAITAGIAVFKHGSLSAALTSAKKEATNLEAIALKLEGEIKTELAAIIARLKSL